jgi:hypothetical protein
MRLHSPKLAPTHIFLNRLFRSIAFSSLHRMLLEIFSPASLAHASGCEKPGRISLVRNG